MHFDICTAFCPKCFSDGSWWKWWKWGERKLQEGGNEPNFDSKFVGIEVTGQRDVFVLNVLSSRSLCLTTHSCHRYGWIPADDDVSDDIRSRYDWVSGLSITHMEILHGAYRCVLL